MFGWRFNGILSVSMAVMASLVLGTLASLVATLFLARQLTDANPRWDPFGYFVAASGRGSTSSEVAQAVERCLAAKIPEARCEVRLTQEGSLHVQAWSIVGDPTSPVVDCLRDAGQSPRELTFGRNVTRLVPHLLARLHGSEVPTDLVSAWLLALASCMPVALLFVGVAASARARLPLPLVPSLTTMTVGAIGGLALVAVNQGLEWLMMMLGTPLSENQAILTALTVRGPWLFAVVSVFCVLAPLGEEIFFRGFVLQRLLRDFNRPIAYAVSTISFALLHFNPSGIPFYLLAGVALAALADRTHSLVPPVAAHVVVNATALLLL